MKVTIEEIKFRLAKHGVTLIATEVISVGKKALVRYPCGHEAEAVLSNVFGGSGCLICYHKRNAERRSLPVNEIRARLAAHGVELIDNDVKRISQKALVRYKCGHEDRVAIQSITHGGHGCARCAGKKHLSTEEHRSKLADLGIDLLSEEVKNTKEKVSVKFPCGHIKDISLNDVYDGHGCHECNNKEAAKKRIIPTETIRSRLGALGIKLLSDSVSNTKEKVLVAFPCGHQHTAEANSLCRGKTGCPICAGLKKLTVDEVRSRLKDVGVDLISTKIKNSKTKATVRFSCGHIAQCDISNIYHNGSRCPICNESRGEREIAAFLDNLGIKFTRQQRADGCKYKGSLRYDFYLPDLKTFVEYHGIQHYEFVKAFHKDKDGFEESQKRDQIKLKWARNNGYRLIVVPYWIADIENLLFCALAVQLDLLS